MQNTILYDVKTSIGINPDADDDETFDNSILMCINSAIAELAELGVGEQGLFEASKTSTWSEYLGEKQSYLLSLIRSYVNVYTKNMFDPPETGPLDAAQNEHRKRLEFRIQTTIEQHEE